MYGELQYRHRLYCFLLLCLKIKNNPTIQHKLDIIPKIAAPSALFDEDRNIAIIKSAMAVIKE